jgi:glycerol-3-phosphate acyltransferase PlsX
MGGDHGPKVVVEGAVMAARRNGISSILVGNREQLDPLLAKYSESDRRLISVHHASQFIQMDESPGLAIRGKPDSSIRVAFELVGEGKASAVVSSGNTGAIMAAGVFVGRYAWR